MTQSRILMATLVTLVTLSVMFYLNYYAERNMWFFERNPLVAGGMGIATAVVFTGLLLSIITDRSQRLSLFVGSATIFTVAFYFTQPKHLLIDNQWMMPLVSEQNIDSLYQHEDAMRDVRVVEVAYQLSQAQEQSIQQLTHILEDIEQNGPATTQYEAANRSKKGAQLTTSLAPQ